MRGFNTQANLQTLSSLLAGPVTQTATSVASRPKPNPRPPQTARFDCPNIREQLQQNNNPSTLRIQQSQGSKNLFRTNNFKQFKHVYCIKYMFMILSSWLILSLLSNRYPQSSIPQTILIRSPGDQSSLQQFLSSTGNPTGYVRNQPVSMYNQQVSQPLRSQVSQNNQRFTSLSNLPNDNFNSIGQIGQNNLRTQNLDDFSASVNFENSLSRPLDDNSQFRHGHSLQ